MMEPLSIIAIYGMASQELNFRSCNKTVIVFVDVSNGKTDHLQGSVYGFRDLMDHLMLEKKMLCYKRLNHRHLDYLETSTDPSGILNE